MEIRKQKRKNMIENLNNTKRRKNTNIVTTLEDLSNELMHEIFDYIDVYDAFRTFHCLNQRFRNLFDHSNLPMKINICSISKSIYGDYVKYIIKPHTNRIRILRICNPFAGNLCLSLFPLMQNFTQLKNFILHDIESKYLVEVIDYLSSLPLLSSLTIQSKDHTRKQNEIYEKIFHLKRLHYCQLSIPTRKFLRPLPFATKNLSPIKHLVIKNKIIYEQLESLLSYVPQIHCLSLGQFDRYGYEDILKSSTVFHHLKNVSLRISSLNFNDFEQLIEHFFQQVKSLHLIVENQSFSNFENGYLNANRWKQLICTSMTNLRIFDFQHQSRSWNRTDMKIKYENEIKKFHSTFWIERQWFFDYQYYLAKSFTIANFYSINPYRAKSYQICKQSKLNIGSCSSRINEISIYSSKAIEQFLGKFSNATHLTLCETFTELDRSILINLQIIIPLKQLTNLNLSYQRLPFEQVLQLLSWTSNLQTLVFDFKLPQKDDDLTSIKQNHLFQLISKRNIVTNLTMTKECSLDKIKLIVVLFPRIQFLTVNLFEDDLKSITRFLLSKSNDCIRYLSLICYSKQRREFMNILTNLFQSEELLDDYTMELIDRKVYLWW